MAADLDWWAPVPHVRFEAWSAAEQFARFVANFRPGVMRHLRRTNPHDPGTNADVVQDVFLSIWARGPFAFRTIERPSAYLNTMATRGLARQRMSMRELAVATVPDLPDPTPATAVSGSTIAATLQDLVGATSTTERTVMLLAVEGYSVAEIADRLGSTERAVLNTVSRLRRRALRGAARPEARGGPDHGAASTGVELAPPPRPGEAQLLTAFRGLTAQQREVLVSAAEGWTPKQIAAICGATPNTVRVALCNARAVMTGQLGCTVEALHARLLVSADRLELIGWTPRRRAPRGAAAGPDSPRPQPRHVAPGRVRCRG